MLRHMMHHYNRRPEVRPQDFAGAVKTPDFESKSQMYAAMPRDVLITIGNQVS
jgi:glycine amidinotransferase